MKSIMLKVFGISEDVLKGSSLYVLYGKNVFHLFLFQKYSSGKNSGLSGY